LSPQDLSPNFGALGRVPFALESSLPGIFAAGDVRADSVKRVAAGVGEGSSSVQSIHRALRDARVSVASVVDSATALE
jgi:thioredoxin reductase (NADPH)